MEERGNFGIVREGIMFQRSLLAAAAAAAARHASSPDIPDAVDVQA